MILHHLLQLRAVGAFAAHAVNVNLIHAQAFHQHFLPDGILLLSADTDISNLQETHLSTEHCPNRVVPAHGTYQKPETNPIGALFLCLAGVCPIETGYF